MCMLYSINYSLFPTIRYLVLAVWGLAAMLDRLPITEHHIFMLIYIISISPINTLIFLI